MSAEIPRACEPMYGCPSCGHDGYFGPAAIIGPAEGEEHHYAQCKRCGCIYLVEVGNG